MLTRKIINFLSIVNFSFYKKKFAVCGQGNRIYRILTIDGAQNISLGNKIVIRDMAWLYAGADAQLIIQSNCEIGHFFHIVSIKKVVIEESVLIADKVFISDSTHNFSNIERPIREQGVSATKEVIIGTGSWLGEHVSVLGVSIGKHCVIGANTVVTHDIPDFSIAVGNPAKVIKRYNFKKGNWQKVDKNGEFI